jgi:hypothetical protein
MKFFRIYSYFTGFSTSDQVLAEKLNERILIWNFAHKQVSQWVNCPESFNQKRWFVFDISNVENGLDVLAFLWKMIFFPHSISRDEIIYFDWNFQNGLLTVKPVYGQSFRSKFLHSIFLLIPMWNITVRKRPLTVVVSVPPETLIVTATGFRRF